MRLPQLLPREEQFFDLFVEVARRAHEASVNRLDRTFITPIDREDIHLLATDLDGDALYHAMLGRLFDEERDPIQIIKWKEIYDNLETTIDEADDVANDLESIVITHA